MPIEEAERVAELFRRMADSRESFAELENTNLHKDGRPIVLETSGVPFLDAGGNLIGYRGIDRDITERKGAGEKLRLFSQAVNSSVDGIAMGDLESRITYVNEAFTGMFGYSREELIGKEIASIYADNQIPKLREAIKTTLEGAWTGELVGRRKNGELFPVALSSSRVVDDKGKVIAQMASHQDITERKRTEQTLRESEERFRTVVTTTKDAIIAVNQEGLITLFNPSAEKMFGHEQVDMIGQQLDCLMPDNFADQHRQYVKRYFLTGRGHGTMGSTVELTALRSDGSVFPIELSLSAAHYADQPFVMAVIRDITERKQAQEALRESEERYRTLFDGSAEGILVVDIETKKFKYANPAICRMLGYTEAELKQMGVVDIHTQDALEHAISEFKAQVRGEKTLAQEIPCLRKDGTMIYADIKSSEVLIDGIECNVGFFTDITERKRADEALRESERRYSTLVESAPDGILAVSVRTRQFLFTNPAICDMMGYSAKELLQKSMEDLVIKGSGDKVKSVFDTLAEGKRDFVVELPITRKDGVTVYVDIKGVRVELDGQEVVIGFFRDVTELREKEILLREQKESLKKLSNRLIEVQENDRKLVARELHDTVAQKLGLAKIRVEKAVLDNASQDNTSLKEASSTISAAISDLRDISTDLRPQMLDDIGLVPTIKWYFERQCQEMKCNFNIIGDQPYIHPYKQVNIFRIFQEILLNIHKHSKADTVDVRIEFTSDRMVLYVADNGKGFDLERVKGTWSSSSSFGLLNISERVELMGGQLTINTKEGGGASFEVSVSVE